MRLTRRVSVICVLAAVCVGTNYMLSILPNVNLMDLVVFIAGYCFGFATGSMIAVLSWLVYGAVNPYGFSPPIFITTVLCEMIYSAFGSIARRHDLIRIRGGSGKRRYVSVEAGALGFLSTLLYDLPTNAICGPLWYHRDSLVESVAIALIVGIPFAVVHQVSNFVIFLLCAVPSITGVMRALR